SYQVSVEDARRNAGRVIKETGVHGVKLEGGAAVAPTVEALVTMGIPVMGHLGFTPQSVHALGGHRIQGREAGAPERLIDDARALERAGAFSLVLELL
ncbi:MAG: 3-methyl-2-oxobutanoate hydroxymethyltransferase, partial [Gemmatimonadetes bacterium]|nr:3-methyl-2-oxobutanoate hydroxymethyltransferase [Gemmatimonadota bacterium]NIT67002.1 3-methyl-2-oxobutanoate hydroxymethyltransferase [Gemmatimonadota bacterium]NIV23794.1 3-methyl-2-oxobutanoate hydroxymethyltransferase [Gemmatimonadota bacterium]NIW75682.1 3-methyl-2-oxobutanoate hydroxymethyltransferase [Gemmatimonadota bacterium]NIY35579.1 3-methyl-2-oxobutanoate hydroxymethyltransferase [Gemmatimonadota bacterium]